MDQYSTGIDKAEPAASALRWRPGQRPVGRRSGGRAGERRAPRPAHRRDCAGEASGRPPEPHRRALANAIGVGADPITGNKLGAGLRFEPCRHRAGLVIGQQIDGTVSLKIDNDGAATLAPAPSPVVAVDDPGHRHAGQAFGEDAARTTRGNHVN